MGVGRKKEGRTGNWPTTNSEKMGRLDKTIVFNMKIIVVIFVFVSLDVLWQELGRPPFF
jgi:hypothetical protein